MPTDTQWTLLELLILSWRPRLWQLLPVNRNTSVAHADQDATLAVWSLWHANS